MTPHDRMEPSGPTALSPSAPRLRVLLTGGRAPVTLELARIFAAAGHTVFVGDSVALPLAGQSRAVRHAFRLPPPRQAPAAFAAALKDRVHRHAIDIVIPTCEEVFHIAAHKDALSVHTTVFCPPLDVLERLHSKHAFQDVVGAAGQRVLPTTRVTSVADAEAALAAHGGRAVLKPEFSRFASSVEVLPKSAAGLGISPETPWVVQPFLPGRASCTWSVAHAGVLKAHAAYGVHFTTSTRRGQGAAVHFAPGERRSAPHAAQHSAQHDEQVSARATVPDARQAFAAAIAGHLELTGQLAFDFIEVSAADAKAENVLRPADNPLEPGLYAIECNPRATSGVHLYGGRGALAAAFVDPTAAPLPAGDTASALLVPLLAYGLAGLRSTADAKRLWHALRTRPVVLDVRDPLPFVMQGLSMASIAATALKTRRGLLAASTHDIEWNGPA